MKALLLSIKPEYANKILSGTKKYEFRKRFANVSVIYIYSTSPVMKIVGTVEVIGILSAPPKKLWLQTKTNAGICYDKFASYFEGCETAYAYKLGEVKAFKRAKSLGDYGIATAPQSFVYIDV